MSLDERMRALAIYRERYLDRGAYDAVLYPGMGDRIHDIEGAAAHGIPTIAVAWGYSDATEHARAVAMADDITGLRGLLGL